MEDLRVKVRSLTAIDGTPIVDLKPALDDDISRRSGAERVGDRRLTVCCAAGSQASS